MVQQEPKPMCGAVLNIEGIHFSCGKELGHADRHGIDHDGKAVVHQVFALTWEGDDRALTLQDAIRQLEKQAVCNHDWIPGGFCQKCYVDRNDLNSVWVTLEKARKELAKIQ